MSAPGSAHKSKVATIGEPTPPRTCTKDVRAPLTVPSELGGLSSGELMTCSSPPPAADDEEASQPSMPQAPAPSAPAMPSALSARPRSPTLGACPPAILQKADAGGVRACRNHSAGGATSALAPASAPPVPGQVVDAGDGGKVAVPLLPATTTMGTAGDDPGRTAVGRTSRGAIDCGVEEVELGTTSARRTTPAIVGTASVGTDDAIEATATARFAESCTNGCTSTAPLAGVPIADAPPKVGVAGVECPVPSPPSLQGAAGGTTLCSSLGEARVVTLAATSVAL